MASRFTFLPGAAEFPASGYPGIDTLNRRAVLSFDDTLPEACIWTFVAPAGLTAPLTLTLHVTAASETNTARAVYFNVEVEAVTEADALNINTTDGFDTANSGNGNVLATAGYKFDVPVALTNADSMVSGDLVRLRVTRDAANGSDDTVGDCYLFAAEFSDDA